MFMQNYLNFNFKVFKNDFSICYIFFLFMDPVRPYIVKVMNLDPSG